MIMITLCSVTTDVQRSIINVTSLSVTVECYFFNGSSSLGCYVEFSGANFSTIAKNITRSTGRQEVAIPGGIDTCVDLRFAVFDWESDGSIGNVPVPVEIFDMRTGDSHISTTIDTIAMKRKDQLLIIIVSSAGGAVVLVMVLIVLILSSGIILVYNKQRMHSR